MGMSPDIEQRIVDLKANLTQDSPEVLAFRQFHMKITFQGKEFILPSWNEIDLQRSNPNPTAYPEDMMVAAFALYNEESEKEQGPGYALERGKTVQEDVNQLAHIIYYQGPQAFFTQQEEQQNS